MSGSNDDRLRTRLAEIRTAAGVPHAQVSLEVLYFLPRDFLDAYAEMFHRALEAGSAKVSPEATRAAVSKTGEGPAAYGPPRRYKKAFVVLDEGVLALKSKMDKRLRGLARDIREELEETEGKRGPAMRTQCADCRCFLADDWQFCPRCGRNRDVRLAG